MPVWVSAVVWSVIKAALLLGFMALNVLFLIWLERKISAFIQRRLGPMRVGKYGWAQTLADGLKMITKEDIIPAAADKPLFVLAPIISFAAALMIWVVVPFGPTAIAADLNIGIVYIAAVTSLAIISVFMSGWGSNNKYSLLGAMRAAAQMISYEVALVMSIIGVVMMAGSLSLQDIVNSQANRGVFGWYLFPQFLGFIIYLMAALAELNRAPFDLMEAESELVSGYHTEYSGIRWGVFMLAEYGHLLSWSAIAAALFLGGWTGPTPADLPGIGYRFGPLVAAVPWLFPFFWFMFKTYIFVAITMWIRWTLPRVRIDQLMDVGWKFLIPAALVNIFVTGLWMMVTKGG